MHSSQRPQTDENRPGSLKMADSGNRENSIRPYGIALAVAILCAIGVSVSSVLLRPYYLDNLEASRVGRLGSMIDALNATGLEVGPESLRAVTVNLDSGVIDPEIDPALYDARKAVLDPTTSKVIPADEDHAGMKRRENHAVVYLVLDAQQTPAVLIVPIWGVGYQSAIYGYLALADDAVEILAIQFYEHGETPGLGSRIQDSQWQQQWSGKQAFDDNGQISIRVGGDSGSNRIDVISGATRTSMGVNGMLRFWLGQHGFDLFLKNFRQGSAGL